MLERGASKDEILLTLHESADVALASPLRTTPFGSANAITSASTADLFRARWRSSAARRARVTGTASSIRQLGVLVGAIVIAVIKHALAGQSPRGATQADCQQAPQFDKACPVPRTRGAQPCPAQRASGRGSGPSRCRDYRPEKRRHNSHWRPPSVSPPTTGSRSPPPIASQYHHVVAVQVHRMHLPATVLNMHQGHIALAHHEHRDVRIDMAVDRPPHPRAAPNKSRPTPDQISRISG
jgi:hypothetical protein